MSGYLSDSDRLCQAEAFVAWCDGTGEVDWRAAFAWWAGPECKDFQPLDARAIAAHVRRIMAQPVEVLTDLEDFFRFAPPAA